MNVIHLQPRLFAEQQTKETLEECSFLLESEENVEYFAGLIKSLHCMDSLVTNLIVAYKHRLKLFHSLYKLSNEKDYAHLDQLLRVLRNEYKSLPPDELMSYFLKRDMKGSMFRYLCGIFKSSLERCSPEMARRAIEFFKSNRQIQNQLKKIFRLAARFPYDIRTVYVRHPVVTEDCCVCLDKTVNYTDCRHSLCLQCMRKLRDTCNKCPLCRRVFNVIIHPEKTKVITIL